MIILWTFAQLLLQYCDSHGYLVLINAKEFKIFAPSPYSHFHWMKIYTKLFDANKLMEIPHFVRVPKVGNCHHQT